MTRRLHAERLVLGGIALTAEQAHHLRRVLRLSEGEAVELFDDAGNVAAGVLRFEGSASASVVVQTIAPPPTRPFSLTIAAAIPKGDRADWMVEKLSELGVDRFIPLAAERSVVLPQGRNKHERWLRIAAESAEQSRRVGTMRIDDLRPVPTAIVELQGTGWVCTTSGVVVPLDRAMRELPSAVTLFIGPEGGWAERELSAFADAGMTLVGLTRTVLRVETAAIAAAAAVLLIGRIN